MQYKPREWTEADKKSMTAMNKRRIEEMAADIIRYFSDPLKKERRTEKVLCKHCYYVYHSRIGGSAITITNCSICGKEMAFGNTCTDKLCSGCAKEREMCSHCGARLD